MKRITIKHLEAKAEWLNKLTDQPETPYIKEDGRLKAQIGNYNISQAYGGYCLHQMFNDGGAVSDIFRCGHVPARELAYRMDAYMEGIRKGIEMEGGKDA